MISTVYSGAASLASTVARAGVLPDDTEITTAMLADEPALDEFVARCLAQLRQVMDGLQ